MNNFFLLGLTLLTLQVMTVMGQYIEKSGNKLLNAINKFSLRLDNKIVTENVGNLVYSPFHAWATIYQISRTADDPTKYEMLRALHSTGVNIDRNKIKTILESIPSFKWRSALYLDRKRMDLKFWQLSSLVERFIKSNWDFNDIDVSEVDFSNREGVSRIINNWVKSQFDSEMKDFITPGYIDEGMLAVTISLMYFKGEWAKKFDVISTESFHLQSGISKEVTMMYTKGSFKHGRLPEIPAQFIELPYGIKESRDPVRMVIIVPDANVDLTRVEVGLYNVSLSDLLAGESGDVNLWVPKFRLETVIDFKAPYEKLGMDGMYSDSATFPDQGIPSKVGKIIHRTLIEMNENGTIVDSAAKPVATRRNRRSITENIYNFRVDRPFLVLICTEGLVLLRAKIVDPNPEEVKTANSIYLTLPTEKEMWSRITNPKALSIPEFYRYIILPTMTVVNEIAKESENKNYEAEDIVNKVMKKG